MKKMFFTLLFLVTTINLLVLHILPVFAETMDQCYVLYGTSGENSQQSLDNCLANATDNDNSTINVAEPTGAISSISSLISGGVTLILIAAGLTAFVYLLLGGIKWITSGGDSGAVEAARNQVIQALVGVIVVLAAWGLIVLVQQATDACFGIGCTVTLPVFQ